MAPLLKQSSCFLPGSLISQGETRCATLVATTQSEAVLAVAGSRLGKGWNCAVCHFRNPQLNIGKRYCVIATGYQQS